jgi:hypothetical protein
MVQKILSAILIGLFLVVNAQAQNWQSIKGEGKVVTQEIQLENIHGVGLGISGKLILTQGNTQRITIEGQQNIIDNIKREVHGGDWNIEFIKNVKDAEPVTITITLPMLDEIDLSGSGTVTSTNKFAHLNELEIGIAGSGHLEFDFEAKSTELSLSGSGKAMLSGESKELEINISGSGNVTAKDLTTGACEVSISGSGNAAVNVNGDLKAAISGSGDVTYKGQANVDASISGSGSVTRMQ